MSNKAYNKKRREAAERRKYINKKNVEERRKLAAEINSKPLPGNTIPATPITGNTDGIHISYKEHSGHEDMITSIELLMSYAGMGSFYFQKPVVDRTEKPHKEKRQEGDTEAQWEVVDTKELPDGRKQLMLQ